MAGISQADKTIRDGDNPAQIVAKKRQHRDLDLNFSLHPIRKDIIPLVDDRAIKQSIKNLLLTNANERPFNLNSGANLRGILFEPNDAITRIRLRSAITQSIAAGEPRVIVQGINIEDRPDTNSYNIQVFFLITQSNIESDLELELRRLR
tara:strand:- start:1756 stop:2205 length:450 start_codon:yes stop_codon:yes gene_type:complete